MLNFFELQKVIKDTCNETHSQFNEKAFKEWFLEAQYGLIKEHSLSKITFYFSKNYLIFN